ncbi:MAG: formylglycine-generating enzyme family protein [Bacteroidota bacterium]
MLRLAYLLVMFQSALLPAQTIHPIIFGDTRDNNSGTGNTVAMGRMKEEITRIDALIPELDVNISSKSYRQGYQCTKANFIAAIDNLQTSDCDVIILFTSLHGYNKGNSPWPHLLFPKNDGSGSYEEYSLDQAFQKLRAMPHRLLLVINQSCNAPDRNKPFCKRDGIIPESPNDFMGEVSEIRYKKLYLDTEGELLVTASAQGEYAYINGNGGYFKQAFFTAIDRETMHDNSRYYSRSSEMWDNILKKTANQIIYFAKPMKATCGPQTLQYHYNLRIVEKDCKDLPIPLPRMIKIQGGSFDMGSTNGSYEKPVHKVSLSSFYLAETEVTFAQYDYYCEQTGEAKPSDHGWGRGNRPVINVSWEDAQAYIKWLNRQPGQLGWRLPTEAEWEYAAGGGSTSRTNYAGSNSNLDSYAVYLSNSGSKTAPVKSKSSNMLGLYDMTGNVYEWCQDWYGENYYSSSPFSNPQGPSSGLHRVLRGGSWDDFDFLCRVVNRRSDYPSRRFNRYGFRLARSL